jgi:hypothetical protein
MDHDYRAILGFITVLLAIGVYIPYCISIVRGTTKPHLYTYVVGALLSGIAFAGSWTSGGGAGSWAVATSCALVVVVALLSLKYGTKDVKPIDGYFAGAALVAIIPWVLTKDPTISIVLVAGIEYLANAPTFRKTWNDPYSEPYTVWGLNTLKHALTIVAVSSASIATVFYPAAIVGFI